MITTITSATAKSSRRLSTQILGVLGVGLLMSVAMLPAHADVIVEQGILPPLSGGADWDENNFPTNYTGHKDTNWDDTSGQTDWETNDNLMHVYNPFSETLYIDNHYSDQFVKLVWLCFVFGDVSGATFPAAPGTKVDPMQWATMTAGDNDDAAANIEPDLLRASWQYDATTDSIGIYMLWKIDPQPQWERAHLSGLIATAPGELCEIRSETLCLIPTPASAALLGLGIAATARRRRPA